MGTQNLGRVGKDQTGGGPLILLEEPGYALRKQGREGAVLLGSRGGLHCPRHGDEFCGTRGRW